ncbi:MAG: 50S ribosomal protein L19, partial [Candidatus Nomurabacteria bacterium GW2011_GWD1_44_10]
MENTTIQMSPVSVASRKDLPIRAGATVKVHLKIEEKGKVRMQIFEGLVLAVKGGSGNGAMFTVRKTASGVGVEKIFPLYSPS